MQWADWLKRCGIQTVAMESTGVYWIPLFQDLLEDRSFTGDNAGFSGHMFIDPGDFSQLFE